MYWSQGIRTSSTSPNSEKALYVDVQKRAPNTLSISSVAFLGTFLTKTLLKLEMTMTIT